jgi:hypothetical protein
MQLTSFDLKDPLFDCFGLAVSVQVVTLENLYGLEPSRVRIRRGDDRLDVHCNQLTWAGQQEEASGQVDLLALRIPDGSLRLRLRAHTGSPIRCLKVLLRDLDPGVSIAAPGVDPVEAGRSGCLLHYPTQLPAPVAAIEAGGQRIAVRIEDTRVTPKRFGAWVERFGPFRGRGVAEIICEQEAAKFSGELTISGLVLEPGVSAEQCLDSHLGFAEESLGLVPWDRREDVPSWARRIALVATLHGMHFTGRIFLRYPEMLDILQFLAERLPGEEILAYLPGWEGRYYWQYGEYRPERELGGADGFARLCHGARELGIHVMPMFGANCANARLPRIARLPESAHLKSATRNRFHGNQPDWDLSRSHDTGWQRWFNPGHPEWQNHLASQIEACSDRFGIDAVFLDTVHAWTNDPDHAVSDGLRALTGRLRNHIPELLLAGEADYDFLLSLFPLFQRPWWTTPPAWTSRYVRRFGHLCEGEPSGRTGVHEFGVFEPLAPPPADPAFIETIAFQDGTLERERETIEAKLRALADHDSRSPEADR